METLLIRLHTDGHASWREGGATRRGSLDEAAARARGLRAVLLVPGESVLLARANIPSRSGGEIQRALPYALEDWLLQPPETQHFAWTREGGSVAAAVVADTTLRGWTDACAEAGLAPDALVSEVLAMPWHAGQWTLLLEGAHALLRTGVLDGFACARELLPALLSSAWERCEEAVRPQRIEVLRHDGEPPALPAELAEAVSLHENASDIDPLAWMQVPSLVLDLLSGPYAGRRARGRRGPWRWLAAALAVAVLSALVLSGTRYVILGHEQRMLEAGIDTLFHSALPEQHRIVDARAQLAEALASAQRGSGGAGSLDLLARVSLPLTEQSGARLQSVDFRDGTLAMSLQLPQAADYTRVRKQLAAEGLQVELTPPPDPRVPAQLRVQAGGGP